MPDRRRHRSAAPGDAELFAPAELPRLRAAVAHLSWLFTRGYAERSALKLVGDRFELRARQRTAVLRAAASDAERAARAASRLDPAGIRGADLAIDGYNLLTTLESALGGAVVVGCRDGCLRDLAGLHGTWRRVAETVPALELVGAWLAEHGAPTCAWLLDRPVSNSGRLKALLEERARERGWPWTAELASDVDGRLARSERTVVSADRAVLDRARAWLNLAAEVVRAHVPEAWVVALGEDPEDAPA